jgi:hypothetical protein
MERTLPEHRTDIVVLVVLSEDIARLLCMFRPFYSPDSGFTVGFKPMLRRSRGGFSRLPNPLRRAESREDFLRAYEAAQEHDYWYLRNARKSRVGFPFTYSLLNAVRFSLLDREEANLYERPEARDRLLHVLGDFASLSRRYRFRPVLLFIPVPSELRAFASGGPYSYRNFVARLRHDPTFADLTVVDLLEHDFDLRRFNNVPFQGHASPYGNEVIARVLYETLRPMLNDSDPRGRSRRSSGCHSRTDAAPGHAMIPPISSGCMNPVRLGELCSPTNRVRSSASLGPAL